MSQEAPVEADAELPTFADCVALEEACADAQPCGIVAAAPSVVRLASEEACAAAASLEMSCVSQQQMGMDSVTNEEALCVVADLVRPPMYRNLRRARLLRSWLNCDDAGCDDAGTFCELPSRGGEEV